MSETIIHGTHGSTTQSEQDRPESNSEDATSKAAMDPGCSTLSTTADVLDNVPPSANPSSSRLLGLPWEIRQQILRLAVPYSITDSWDETYWFSGSTEVLRTCHQLHSEERTLLYSLNPFYLIIHPRASTTGGFEDQYDDVSLHFQQWNVVCPNCKDDDDSWEACWKNGTHPSRWLLDTLFPLKRLEKADVISVRDWVLKIYGHKDSLSDAIDTSDLREIQDYVSHVAEKYLSQGRRLRKVTVLWGDYLLDGEESDPEYMGSREAAVKPLKSLGVPIEERMLHN